jgi:hypothetical protein
MLPTPQKLRTMNKPLTHTIKIFLKAVLQTNNNPSHISAVTLNR